MSTSGQIRLLAVFRPEGISWEMRDEAQRVGFGSCATAEELRMVEIRAGLSTVVISGELSVRNRDYAQHCGWTFGEVSP